MQTLILIFPKEIMRLLMFSVSIVQEIRQLSLYSLLPSRVEDFL